ncbi:CD3324 family protein [Dethiothermospora halolimnae]|uniref:CD3324 family protein n=1 Tax=Dethiothermospora halolimnae TaxID=3114390 RepID=UPI003CCBBAB6
MSYKKATEILPDHLIEEVQKYISGTLLYIPKSGKKAGWGQVSGARELLNKRNNKIYNMFKEGIDIEELSKIFHLSDETIKKIVYSKE